MIKMSDFPKELFIKLEGQEFLEARLSINEMKSSYWVEVDIVQKESRKIWAHVGNLYNVPDEDEAIYKAVQLTADFLKPKHIK